MAGGSGKREEAVAVEVPVRRENGSAKQHIIDDEDDGVKENIFLFAPNVIGKLIVKPASALPTRHAKLTIVLRRIRTCHPRRRIALLHASPPTHLLPSLQRLVSSRCSRRYRRTPLQSIDDLWRRSRHGDGSLHNGVSARLLEFGVAAMGHLVPGLDQFGSGEPLYAHVCDVDNGRIGAKSQEGRFEPELGVASVLHEPGMSSKHYNLDSPFHTTNI